MIWNRLSVWILGLVLGGALFGTSVPVWGQGQPLHPPAPGQVSRTPLFPIGMFPRGNLPYSWELGKERTQVFGDFRVGDPADSVERLIKQKRKEIKEKSKQTRKQKIR